ncbi:MAG: hypothetical protein K9M44_01215 [Candidatus Pacebacteria bacterium]|nr:hypothetical protein [Candidatus Paceibacterota bacterium]
MDPDPPVPPNPEFITLTVRAVDSHLLTSKLAVPALGMENRVMPAVSLDPVVTEKKIFFDYEDFHNTSQLIKVEFILDPDGDGKAPYEVFELEQTVLIDEDKVIVFSQ